MKKVKYSGIWWLPSQPERRIAGDLEFNDKDGILLSLFEVLSNEDKDEDIICGVASTAEKITLIECQYVGISIFSKDTISTRTCRYALSKIIIGENINSIEDIKIEWIEMRLPYLEKWIQRHGIAMKILPSDLINVESISNPIIQHEIGSVSVEFVNKVMFDNNLFSDNKVAFEDYYYLKIADKNNSNLEHYMDTLTLIIMRFFAMIWSEPIFPLEVNIKCKGCANALKYISSITQHTIEESIIKKPMFIYRDMAGNFEEIMNKWFEKSNRLEFIFNLYFGIIYNVEMFIEQKFMFLIQALEVYHRLTQTGKYLTDDETKEIRDIMINSIPEKIELTKKEILKSKLNYLNEITLKERVLFILNKYKTIIEEIIPDIEEFAKKVRNTRNYYTHFSKDDSKPVFEDEELFIASEQLKILVEICILSEIGFTDEKIATIIKSSQNLKSVKYMLSNKK